MICPTIWRVFLLIGGLALAAAPARAQLALPGAAPAAPAGAPTAAPKPKKSTGGAKDKAAKAGNVRPEVRARRRIDRRSPADAERRNGAPPDLRPRTTRCRSTSSASPARACRTPPSAASSISSAKSRSRRPGAGRPDGLDRYEVDVPACPFAFDVVDGAVLVPVADHRLRVQGGRLPDQPERALGAGRRRRSRRTPRRSANAAPRPRTPWLGRCTGSKIAPRDNPDAANLVREQSGFTGERDDICRDYVKEVGARILRRDRHRGPRRAARGPARGASAARQGRQEREVRKARGARKPKPANAAAAKPQ